ncbi:MAG: hypothetical protein CIT01_04650 [Methanobacterium sp. BRmetb2]|jgi:Ca2+/Na+ antiporter|nr:MAG: hypothetical protein CIT01_04650 [Methanobacterium sp. BRmetb2]
MSDNKDGRGFLDMGSLSLMKSNYNRFATASSITPGMFLIDNFYIFLVLLVLLLTFLLIYLFYRNKKIKETDKELVLRRSKVKGHISGLRNRSKKSTDVEWLEEKLDEDSKIDRILK